MLLLQSPAVSTTGLAVLRRLPSGVRLLVVGSFVNRAGTLVVPYLTVVLRREFLLPERDAGLVMMAFGSGSIASLLVGGYLTDRLGRRRTLQIALFGSASVALAMAAAPGLAVLVPLLVAFGFVAELYRPAASAVISDLLPSAERALGYAALRMAVNLGFAVGMVAGAVLVDVSWRLLFLIDGLTTLAYGLLVLAYLAETRPPEGEAEASQVPAWRDGVFVAMLAAGFLFSLLFFTDVTVLPFTVLEAGYPTVVYGVLVGTNGLLIALFEVSVVHSLQGLRRLRVAAAGAALVGVAYVLLGVERHWGALLASVVIWTLGEILSSPQQMAFVADWAPPRARGRYLATYQATWFGAFAVNPLLFLPLRARLGEDLFWPVVALLSLPAAGLLVALDRFDQPQHLRGRAAIAPPD